MNNQSLHTLVNFRASRILLESFDRVCQLSGKTRTQALSEMMRQRVSTVGSKLVEKIETERAINERLKNAVERRSELETTDPSKGMVGRRQKPFKTVFFARF